MLKTFKIGGVHPPQYKLSEDKKIITAPVPKLAVISLAQHIGKPAIPIVEKGDEVTIGQLIAKADGFVSANIHSSVSGKVLKIDDAPDICGYKSTAIYIETEGNVWSEEIIRKQEIDPICSLTPEQIISKIQKLGIVGMGGATFPTHVKLSIPEGKKVDTLIINAAECEPFLTADHQLMLEKTKEILIGIHIIMKAINANEAIIGIENNKIDAISLLENTATRYLGVSILPLKEKYPQGGEKQIIDAATKRKVPEGKLPIDVGVIVVNVATAFAVYEAVQKNKPLIERVVTITGPSVKNPVNVLARIGTPFSELAEMAGGMPEDTGKIVIGGPMMGRAVTNLEIPVTKGSSGLLFMPNDALFRKEIHNCTRCGKCIYACPMGLEPYLLVKLAENRMWEKMEEKHIMSCIECGCCLYTCPSNIPLLDYVKLGKRTVTEILKKRLKVNG
jgi:electron transport complex protein RnfC